MKKILILIMIIVLIVGCSKTNIEGVSTSNNNNTLTKPDISSKESALDILNIYSVSVDDYPEKGKYNQIPEWKKYFNEKYGVTINLEINVIERPKDYIYYVNSYTARDNMNIHQLVDEVELNRLNEYYDQYDWYRNVDSKYIELLKKGDDIVAIPCVDETFVRTRYYNKKFIDTLEIEVPDTISSFTEYLQKVKVLNEEIVDYYPMVIDLDNVTKQTSDIFRAFDVYVNSTSESMIALNPKTGSYEDAVFANEFKTSLTYFDMLQDNGVLKFSRNLMRIITDNYVLDTDNLATEYTAIYGEYGSEYKNFSPLYDCYKGYYLEGINSEKLIEIRKDLSFYLFPKEISNINEVIGLFDKTFNNSNHYADLRYGIEGVDYIVDDENIKTEFNDNYEYIDLNTIAYVNDSNKIPEEEYKIITYSPETLIYDTSILTDVLAISRGDSHFRLETALSNFCKTFACERTSAVFADGYYSSDFEMEWNIDETIKRYKKDFLKHGMDKTIDELNKKIGSKTTYDYSD